MYFRKSLGLAVLVSAFLAGSVEASGMFPLGTNVLAHKSPEGNVAFVTGPDVPMLKVYTPDSSAAAYYFEFWNQSRKLTKQQGPIHARLLADGQEIPLTLVGDEADMHATDIFSGQYCVSKAALQQAAGAKSYQFQLVNDEGKVLWQQEGKGKTTQALGKLLATKPQSYLREGVIRDEKASDSVRRDARPRVFLPNISPTQVQAWLFLHRESLLKDKLGKAIYENFDFYYHKKNPDIVVFSGRPLGDGLPLITFETRPYNGGTMLALMKDQERYDRWQGASYTTGMMQADDDLVSLTSTWRFLDDQWDGFLNDAYKAFNDYADFGFALNMTHKKGEGNRFFVASVRDNLPALAKGDELLSLNGEDVAWYKPNELQLKLLQMREKTVFNVRTSAGEERDVSIAPVIKGKENTSILPTDRDAFFKAHKIKGDNSADVNAGNYPELFRLADSTYQQPSVRELWQKAQQEKKRQRPLRKSNLHLLAGAGRKRGIYERRRINFAGSKAQP